MASQHELAMRIPEPHRSLYMGMWTVIFCQPLDADGVYNFRLPVYVTLDGQAELVDWDLSHPGENLIYFDAGDFFDMFLAMDWDSQSHLLRWRIEESTETGPEFILEITDSNSGMPMPEDWAEEMRQGARYDRHKFIADFTDYFQKQLTWTRSVESRYAYIPGSNK